MALSKQKPRTSGQKAVRLDSEVDVFDITKYDKQWVVLRLIGPCTSYGKGWADLGKSEETGKAIRFPKVIPGYDPVTQEFDGKDAYQKFAEAYPENLRIGQAYLQNVIVRVLQEDYNHAKSKKLRTDAEKKGRKFPSYTEDENKYYFKESKSSKAKTPVQVWEITSNFMDKLQNLKSANGIMIKGTKKFFDIDDAKHGADIQLMYDSSKKGTDKLQVMIETKNVPLTDEEMQYLLWVIDPEKLESCKKDNPDAAKAEVSRWKKRLEGEDADDEDDDGSAKKKKKKNNKYLDDDDDDKPKGKKGGKKRRDDDEEDDLDDDDDDLSDSFDDDDDEEDEPRKKKGKVKPKAKKKPSRDDDEDDEDLDDDEEDDFDEDDEEDEPRSKKKPPVKAGKKKPKRRSRDDDDEDDD